MALLEDLGSGLRQEQTTIAGQPSNRTASRFLMEVGLGITYAVLFLLFTVPFMWMLFGSIRNEAEIFANLYPFTWNTILPIEWTLKSYADIFGISDDGQKYGLQFQRFLGNSFYVSFSVVCSSLIFNTLAAYFLLASGFLSSPFCWCSSWPPCWCLFRPLSFHSTLWSMR